jgi:DNA-binding PadR family transcriptional regulator
MVRKRAPSRQARELLAVLLERPADWRHGYELAKLAGLSSGTLYPLLIRLNERGLLEARWMASDGSGRPPRHAYRLTSEGVAFARAIEAGVSAGLTPSEALA